MKTYINIFLILMSTLSISFVSCQKDKGNYIYKNIKINESNQIRAVAAEVGTTIQINPSIAWADGVVDTTQFSYEWRLFGNTIGSTRNLEFLPPRIGTYPLVLYITDLETQHVSRIIYRISANSIYQDGWLILSEGTDGQSKIHLIKPTRTVENNAVVYHFRSFKNLYETNFKKTLGTNPKKVITAIFPANDRDEILILQSGGKSLFLNGADFSEHVYLTKYLPPWVNQSGIQPVAFFDLGDANQVLMDNGQIFWKMNSGQVNGSHEGSFYQDPLFFERGANITSFADKFINNLSNFHLVYDAKNARLLAFMANSRFAATKLEITYSTPRPSEFANVHDLSAFEHKYIGDYGTGNNFIHIIKERATGIYYLQDFATRAAERKYLQLSVMSQIPFPSAGLVNDETVYHRMKKTSYLLFATGSKFYFYDVNTKVSKLYHDFGTGKIVKLAPNDLNNHIGVALSDGRFAICNFDQITLVKPNPGSEGGILFEEQNLERIVDFNWKWGSKSNFTARSQ